VLRRPVEPAGVDRKWLAEGQTDANDPYRKSCRFIQNKAPGPFKG
jgi:hypothetical protein